MTRLNALLAFALILSCLYLVNVSYDSRRLFVALERLQAQAGKLETDRKRLEAERQAQATHLRVEKLARDRLKMHQAGPGVTIYVTDPSSAASGSPRIASVPPSLPGDPPATRGVR